METTTLKNNVDALFYSGGTDIEVFETSVGINGKAPGIKVGFNDNYFFVFDGKKIVKAIKYEINSEWTYKILKTKLVIQSEEEFKKFLTKTETITSIIATVLRMFIFGLPKKGMFEYPLWQQADGDIPRYQYCLWADNWEDAKKKFTERNYKLLRSKEVVDSFRHDNIQYYLENKPTKL